MASGFSVTIQAVDKVTATLNKINKSALAMSAPFQRTQKALAKFGEVSGLNRVGASLRSVANSAFDVFGKVSQIIAPLGAITGAASLAGMYRMISAWSEWGSKLGFAAANMGVAATQLSTWQGAAQLAGTSASALTSGMQTLGQNMFDAVGGRNAEFVVMMNALGLSFRDATGHARAVGDVMPEVAAKIRSMRDPMAQLRAATTLFGGAAVEMMPFIRQSADGIARYNKIAQSYGYVTQGSIDAANNFRVSQTELTLAVSGLGNRISTELSPIIAPLLSQLGHWIATSPQVTAGVAALGRGVGQLSTWLQGIDWSAEATRLEGWGSSIMAVVNDLGGFRTILEVAAGFMAVKWVGSTVLFGASLVRLGVTAARVGLMFGALLLTPVGAAVAGAVIAIAALGVAGYELWKHWDVVSQHFKNLWAALRTGFAQVWADISPFLERIKDGINAIANSWLGKKLGLVAETVVTGVQTVGSTIAGAVSSGNPNAPRGIRNNNPLNLSYRSDQVGVAGSDGRFGQFRTMSEGIAADERQLLRYQDSGTNTLAKIIAKWSPSSENDTAGYIKTASALSGLDPNARLNLRDPATAAKLISAMSHQENGGRLDPGDVQKGIALALGSPGASPAGAPVQMAQAQGAPVAAPGAGSQQARGGDGTVRIQLDHGNAPPPGFRAAVTGSSGSMAGAQVAQANVTGGLP